jgi:hypothetical protein
MVARSNGFDSAGGSMNSDDVKVSVARRYERFADAFGRVVHEGPC